MANQRPLRIIIGAILFLMAIMVDSQWETGSYRILLYGIPYLVSGHQVLVTAIQNLFKGKVFDEFSLMSLATLGAFVIGEYPEGVFVMIFYELGEFAQHKAVSNARKQIESLVDQRPEVAQVKINDEWIETPAEKVSPGSQVRVRKGEQIPIDGKLITNSAVFNTSSITGEPMPRQFEKGEKVLSGYINEGGPAVIKTTDLFEESTFSRIIQLTKKASEHKAPTENFFRRFAKIYTPAVAVLALGIFLLPLIWVEDYHWQTWLYRACVFLVISCPCALVLSIPLTYFAGIGSAGKSGILTKGANQLDQLSKLNGIVFDKTGTLTKGELEIVDMETVREEKYALAAAYTLSSQSTHPVSHAISEFLDQKNVNKSFQLERITEVSGKGIKGYLDNKEVRLGAPIWINSNDISNERSVPDGSEVHLSIDNELIYIFRLKDDLKEDAAGVIKYLNQESFKTFLLSGDQSNIVERYGRELAFFQYKGEVGPEEKLETYNSWKKESSGLLAFAGDGINDSIVMAAADVGIAMGNKGADIAIETADIIIPGDRLSHIPQAIQIGRKTQSILWQNIILVLLVKLIVLALGGVGFVSLWMAILADVGIALIAVLNAGRLIYFKPTFSYGSL